MTSSTRAATIVPPEVELSDAAELLYRQATSPLWDPANKQPSSHAFGPSTADQGKPSFSRSSIVTAQASRDWHNANARSHSHGVWACSVGEVIESETRAVDDSATPEALAPGHCYVDYRGLTRLQITTIRSLLLARALERGVVETD